MPKRTDISRFAVIALILVSTRLVLAEKPDTRFQWSLEKFASQCGFKAMDYPKAHFDLFTDHDYSAKWVMVKAEAYKHCKNCYRSANLTSVDGVRITQLTTDNESGDWMYYISYCYDASGKLRAINADFNCAWGWSYVRVYAYSGDAPRLLEERWQDLETGNKISEPDNANEMKHHWTDLPVYKTFSDLPFAKLIQN